MPTRRVSRGGLTGQLSINDELLNQLLQGGKAASKSFSVRQFAEMFEEHTGSGGPAVGTAAAQKVPSASEALGTAGASEPGRSRSRRGSANPTTSSGSGKTSEEIWKNIQLTGAESLQGPPSILSTPQGSGALGSGGGGLGLGGMGTLTGRLSIPTGSMLFPQKSIDRLVEQHGAGAGGKTVNRPASEWMDMMMATLPSGVPKGMQPTPSARFALETAAAEASSKLAAATRMLKSASIEAAKSFEISENLLSRARKAAAHARVVEKEAAVAETEAIDSRAEEFAARAMVARLVLNADHAEKECDDYDK